MFYSYLTGATGRRRALIGPQTSLLRERDIEIWYSERERCRYRERGTARERDTDTSTERERYRERERGSDTEG